MKVASILKNPLSIPVITLAILIIILVSIQTATSELPKNNELHQNHSIYNKENSGYRGWFLTMEKAGVEVNVWRKPFEKLAELPQPATLVISQPQSAIAGNKISFHEEQFKLLTQWVSQGNSVILIDTINRGWLKKALKEEGITTHQTHRAVIKKSPSKKTTSSSDKPPIKNYALTINPNFNDLSAFISQPIITHTPKRLSLKSLSGHNDQWLLKDEKGNPALIKIQYLKGHLIIGTTPDIVSNQFIAENTHDNYQFMTNLILSEGHPVYINEYVHGNGAENDIMAYLNQNTPLGKVFVQLTFIFVLLLWLSFTPWHPKIKDTLQQESQEIKTLVQSLAGILFRYQSGCLALKNLLKQIEKTTEKTYQTPISDTSKLKRIIEARLNGSYTQDQVQSNKQRYNNDEATALTLVTALDESILIVDKKQKISHQKALQLTQQLHQLQDILSYDRTST